MGSEMCIRDRPCCTLSFQMDLKSAGNHWANRLTPNLMNLINWRPGEDLLRAPKCKKSRCIHGWSRWWPNNGTRNPPTHSERTPPRGTLPRARNLPEKKTASLAPAIQQPSSSPKRALAHLAGFAAFGDRFARRHLHSDRFPWGHDCSRPGSLLQLALRVIK